MRPSVFLESFKLSCGNIIQRSNNLNFIFCTLIAFNVLWNIGSQNTLSQNKMISMRISIEDILSLRLMYNNVFSESLTLFIPKLLFLLLKKLFFSHTFPTAGSSSPVLDYAKSNCIFRLLSFSVACLVISKKSAFSRVF